MAEEKDDVQTLPDATPERDDVIGDLLHRVARLEAQLAGSDSETHFRLAVEAAPTALLMVDQEGDITLVNAQCERLFGYLRDELVGEPMEVLVPLRFRARHPGFRQSFFRSPRARSMGVGRDLYGLHRDGSEIPIEIGLSPLRAGNREIVLASIVDITERKRAEAMFRGAVEASPTAMLMVNAEGEIQLTNQQVEETFGYTRDELMGQSIEMLVPDDTRAEHPMLRKKFFATPVSRAMGSGRDLHALHKSGRRFPVEIGLNPIRTQEGSLVLASVVDVTERRKLEHQLKAANRGLETRVEERTQELAQRNSELVRLNADLERFAYVASHDLKEPLRMVVSFTQRLASEYQELLDDRGKKYIEFASAGAQRMHDLLSDLLRYSQLDSKSQEPREVDTQRCLDGVRENLQLLLEEREIELSVPEPLPPVFADASQVGQIFQNLIGNAAKFCEPGARVRVRWRAEGQRHRFWVVDDGPGIDPRFHARVFEVFQRLETAKEGSGVGLSIVKRIVEKHGGEIELESAVGQGASFTFTLPRPPSEPAHG